MESQLTTPVLFLVFNRPDSTERVFDAIRTVRPQQLFIASDGPRLDVEGEVEKCMQVRTVVNRIDWPCTVKTLFREKNLGLGKAVAGSITWFFEHVEEGIILEDDTLPSQKFFRFCSEMLAYYRNDTRVMSVCGSAFPNSLMSRSPYSYFFSDWDYPWGWATWRRAWNLFDYKMTGYPEAVRNKYLLNNYSCLYERYYTQFMMDRSYYESDEVTWWSVQWGFCRKMNSGLVVAPLKNMVINLGLGAEATNTVNASEWSFMNFEEMSFPLKHPPVMIRDRRTDREVFIRFYTNAFQRTKTWIKHITPIQAYDMVKTTFHKYLSSVVVFAFQPLMTSLENWYTLLK
jgi:hypothetical protein